MLPSAILTGLLTAVVSSATAMFCIWWISILLPDQSSDARVGAAFAMMFAGAIAAVAGFVGGMRAGYTLPTLTHLKYMGTTLAVIAGLCVLSGGVKWLTQERKPKVAERIVEGKPVDMEFEIEAAGFHWPPKEPVNSISLVIITVDGSRLDHRMETVKARMVDGRWLLHQAIPVQAQLSREAILYVGSNSVASFPIEESPYPASFAWSKWQNSEREEYGRFTFRHRLGFRTEGKRSN